MQQHTQPTQQAILDIPEVVCDLCQALTVSPMDLYEYMGEICKVCPSCYDENDGDERKRKWEGREKWREMQEDEEVGK